MPEVVDDSVVLPGAVAEAPVQEVVPDSRLLRGPVGPALLWLAAPVLAEQFLNLLVGLTDTYLAGTVSKEATAAIGLATQVGWLVGLLFGFIGAGATALVSRYSGAGDARTANHFSNQAIAAAAVMGLLATGLVWTGAPWLPRVLRWEPGPAGIAIEYLRIDAWSYMFFSITAIAAACWRGTGDTRTPLYIMALVNAVNIALSAGLRFGWGGMPYLGVTGIAVGTMVARILGGMLVLALLLHGRGHLRLIGVELRFRADSMTRLLRVGIPAGVDGSLLWAGQFLFLMIISRLGTGELQAANVAAHFVGIRVEALSYMPAFAWAVAASTMVGQSLGARDPARALRSGHLAAMQGAAMCALMGVGYFVFARPIYAAFSSEADFELVARVGVPALRALAFFQIPLAFMIIYTNALRGAGDTRHPLAYTVIGMSVRLMLGYLCGIVLQGGLLGAWVGMFADMTLRATLSFLRFSGGKWQRVRV